MNTTYRTTALELFLDALPLIVAATKEIRPRDKRLANQLEDAANSVALNLSEADTTCRGNSRARVQTAFGSLKETRTNLRLAVIWEHITQETHEDVDSLLDRVTAMTWKRLQARR